jgi:predicted XRE-type DNA-binding protein
VLTHGPIPDGLKVLHTCDVRNCVNPAHLWLGTQADNVADCVTKGRASNGAHVHRGSRHGNSKLTEAVVAEIRQRYAAGGVSQQTLANHFGVSQSVVSELVNRVGWKHV